MAKANKPTTKKTTAAKVSKPAKKTVATKSVAKKATPKKAVSKTPAPTKKAATSKVAPKKASTSKTTAKKVTTKVAPKKATPKKVAVKPTIAKKVETKVVAKSTAKAKSTATKVATKATQKKAVASNISSNKKNEKTTKKTIEKAPLKKVSKQNAIPTKKATSQKASTKKQTKIKLGAVEIAKTKARVSTQHAPTLTTDIYVHKEKDLKPLTKEQRTIVRYSDEELEEFKTIIQSNITKAKSEIEYYQDQIKSSADNDTKFTGMEDGSYSSERESMTQIIVRQQKLIVHLENALARIENKTYGICRETGLLIPKERLRVVPHATLSVEGKKKQK